LVTDRLSRNRDSSNPPSGLSTNAQLAAEIGRRVASVWFAIHVRRVPLHSVLDACGLALPDGPPPDPGTVARIVRYVDRFRRVLRFKCLERSIVLCYFLRREGLPVTINMGVRRAARGLQGHSWLSLGDEIIYERGPDSLTYTRVLVWPTPAAE
jgi:hypothetical protein